MSFNLTVPSRLAWSLSIVIFAGHAVAQRPTDRLIADLQKVGPRASGHEAAAEAVAQLCQSPIDALIPVLAGFDDDNPLAENWLRGAAQAIVDRHLREGGQLPQAELTRFLQDRNHSTAARYLAFQLVEDRDRQAAADLIPSMLNDPCLDLRRRSVAREIDAARELVQSGEKSSARERYRVTLAAARDVDQIEAIAEQLTELGEEVDLVGHFGFLTAWHLIGPFDHAGSRAFDEAYPPEKTVDLTASYEGKEGTVSWTLHETDDEFGIVDLNAAIAKHMGAIAYAYTEFESGLDRSVELRLGCINANKVWLNGELLTANEVYHSSTAIDQYVGRGQLRAGKNTILVKIAQNEQTEPWAQRWQFQLRACDELGTAMAAASYETAEP